MMACGVLLAAGLVHQLPDSAASFEALAKASAASEDDPHYWNGRRIFPWSYFICGLVFVLFLIMEESVHLWLESDDDGGSESHSSRCPHHRDSKSQTQSEIGNTYQHSCRGNVAVVGSGSFNDHHEHNHDHMHSIAPGEMDSLLFVINSEKIAESEPFTSWAAGNASIIRGDPLRKSVAGSHHHHESHIMEHLHGSMLAAVFLLLALSVHSVLAGLTMGLVHDRDSIVSTAVAILAHKGFAGYAFGSTMVAADLGWNQHLPLALIFSSSTPVGILFGMGTAAILAPRTATEHYEGGQVAESDASLLVAIAKAVVAGTFSYVAIFELGVKELLICREDPNSKSSMISFSQKQAEVLKLVSVLVGFLAMSALALFI
ncbi:hypothetical protein ACA910_019895 [Epithemia clementina (nom. ined.)]